LNNYLQLVRIHTASLTIPTVVIGYLLATNTPSPLYIFLISIYALLFHAFGFLWNNIFDYQYDKNDPYKRHFPLVNGQISYKRAKYIAITGTSASFVYGLFLFNNNILAITTFILAIFFGFLYNLLNKKFKHAIVYISLSFVMLVMSPYLNFHVLDYKILIYGSFAFATMVFQNGISGFIKDMRVGQINTLTYLGTRLEGDKLIVSNYTDIYAYIIRLVIVMLGIALANNIYTMFLFIVVQAIVILLSFKLLQSGVFNRDYRVRLMAIIEIMNYYSLAIIMIGYTSIIWDTFLFAFPILYYILMNKITWGTIIKPAV